MHADPNPTEEPSRGNDSTGSNPTPTNLSNDIGPLPNDTEGRSIVHTPREVKISSLPLLDLRRAADVLDLNSDTILTTRDSPQLDPHDEVMNWAREAGEFVIRHVESLKNIGMSDLEFDSENRALIDSGSWYAPQSGRFANCIVGELFANLGGAEPLSVVPPLEYIDGELSGGIRRAWVPEPFPDSRQEACLLLVIPNGGGTPELHFQANGKAIEQLVLNLRLALSTDRRISSTEKSMQSSYLLHVLNQHLRQWTFQQSLTSGSSIQSTVTGSTPPVIRNVVSRSKSIVDDGRAISFLITATVPELVKQDSKGSIAIDKDNLPILPKDSEQAVRDLKLNNKGDSTSPSEVRLVDKVFRVHVTADDESIVIVSMTLHVDKPQQS